MAVIEVHNLKKHFGSSKAVDGISFAVEKGEVFGFLGPNGAGKTTTIRCLMDFIRPTAGSATVAGMDVQSESASVKQRVGYLSPDVPLYPNWSGNDHIAFVQHMRGGHANRIKELSKRLQFDPHKKARSLSSGNKQKLGLILALMSDPQLLIMDEPTSALDPLLLRNRSSI